VIYRKKSYDFGIRILKVYLKSVCTDNNMHGRSHRFRNPFLRRSANGSSTEHQPMPNKLSFIFKKDRFGAFFWTGVILLLLGFGTFSYANSVVEAHKQMLQSNLSDSERDRIGGSLSWWRIAQITLFDPISLIFIITGTFSIAYACIWKSTQPA
jgi:hypothetical protein